MKKYHISTIFSMLLMSLLAVNAVARSQMQTVDKVKAKKTSTLFVIKGDGLIMGSQQKGFILTLRKLDARVIWFADRPVRKAGHLHINKFMKMWNQGKNSFSEDPPNAVIIAGTRTPVVVELTLLNFQKRVASFHVKTIDGVLHSYKGPLTIFIDEDDAKVASYMY